VYVWSGLEPRITGNSTNPYTPGDLLNLFMGMEHLLLNFKSRNNNNNNIRVKLDNKHRYVHVPKLVEKNHESKFAILWNQQMRTDNAIPDNKPDIIIRNNKKELAC
jgi:hypothetical protein